MRGKSAVVTFDHDPSAGTERLRPPGEDAPVWLAPLLAIAGVLASIWVAGEALEPRVSPEVTPLAIARPEPIATNEGPSMSAPAGAPSTMATEPVGASVAPIGEATPASRDARTAPTASATLPTAPPPSLAPSSAAAAGSAGAVPIAQSEEPVSPSAVSSTTPIVAPVASGGAPTPVPARDLPSAPPPSLDTAPSVTAPAVTAPNTTPTTTPTPAVSAAPAPVGVVPAPTAASTTPDRAATEPSAVAPCLPMVTIPFGHDSTKPLVEGREAAVRPIVDWLAAHPEATVSVEGHADTVGTEDYNIVLSFGRARAVAAWLGRLGVAPARIATRAAGTTPAKGSSSDVSTNRLVVLQIEGVDVCRVPGDATKRP